MANRVMNILQRSIKQSKNILCSCLTLQSSKEIFHHRSNAKMFTLRNAMFKVTKRVEIQTMEMVAKVLTEIDKKTC